REAARADLDELGEAEGEVDDSLAIAYEQAEARVAALATEVEQIRDELHVSERERDALAARTSALSMAVDQRDGSTAIVEAGVRGIRGHVADHVKVRPGFEAAIAAALGSLADAVLADDHDAAIAGLDHARSSDAGRVEIVVAAAARAESLGSLPEG